jgi:hypothetical protein
VLWHGYLLGGTGSNVYTRALAREWSRAGHDVTVVCQERRPERYGLGGATVVVPDLPEHLLPVFVLDAYEGLRPKLMQDFTERELAAYVASNADACDELQPELLFTNHVLAGGAVGAASSVDNWAVKAHGSELEYSMRDNERLARYGADVLVDARAVFVGSAHIRAVLEEVVGHVDRVHEAPPGTLFTGALEHRHLVHLLPLCDVAVVPSIFPEAFGMVAAEAAAAGVPPLVAAHSGLAEIAAGVAAEYPPELAPLTSFPTGDADQLRRRLRALLALAADDRRQLGLAARRAVEARWSWARVSQRLLDPLPF